MYSVVFAIAFSSLAASGPQQPAHTDAKPALTDGPKGNQQSDVEIMSKAVTDAPSDPKRPQAGQEKQGQTDNQTVAWYDHNWVGFSLTFLTLFVNGIGLVIISRQVRSSEEAAGASSRSAEALMISERAWLLVTPSDWSPKYETFGPTIRTQFSVFVLAVKNVGKTPAHIQASAFRYLVLNDIADLPSEPAYSEPTLFNGRLLTPQDSYQETREIDGWKLPEQGNELFLLLNRHERFLYCFGYVKYKDDFGRERETRVGYIQEFFPQGAPNPRIVRRQAGPPAYNRAT